MPICRRLPPAAARRTPKLGPRSCRTRGASPRAAAVVASRGSGRRTAALRATRPCCTNDPGAQDAMAGLEGLADHYDLVIVGAGLSGAVFAEQAASRYGLSSLIIDKRDHIGACATARLRPGRFGATPTAVHVARHLPAAAPAAHARRKARTAARDTTQTLPRSPAVLLRRARPLMRRTRARRRQLLRLHRQARHPREPIRRALVPHAGAARSRQHVRCGGQRGTAGALTRARPAERARVEVCEQVVGMDAV